MNSTTLRPRARIAGAALVFAAAVAIYAPTFGHGFINWDDYATVRDNPMLSLGIGRELFERAFQPYEANWIPLTWISLAVDRALFGASPGATHAVNAVLHGATAALLFAAFARATGAALPALLVALAFALHPLRVESVAWATERKDVLSGLCFVAAVAAWLAYGRRPSAWRYGAAFVAAALSLGAKATAVTLPFVLLLVDFWPLGRLDDRAARRRAALEKLPFLALSVAVSLLTIEAQRAGGAFRPLGDVPLDVRAANAAMSVLWYAEKALWPTGLAAFYPHPQSLPPANVLGLTVFAGAALTIGVLALARRRPWLCVGWLWFLGMLVPMSGLVQVGMQARADRYAYLPMIGLELAIAYELWAWLASRRAVYAVLTTGVALALAAATHRQVGYWQDGGTLFGRALAVTDDNFLAHEQVGRARLAAGDSEGAARHFSEALRIEPRWAKARSGLGLALQAQGRREEAIWNHREAVRLDPNDGALRLALAAALIEAGWTDDAIRELRIGARRTPVRHASRAAVAHRLGQLLQQRGRDAEAIDAYRGALAAKPDHAAARNDVAWLLAASHNPGLRKPDEALQLAESNAPEGDANRLDTLAVALAANGRFAEALAALDRAEVALAPEDAALAAGIETRRRAFESSRAWIDEAPPR